MHVKRQLLAVATAGLMLLNGCSIRPTPPDFEQTVTVRGAAKDATVKEVTNPITAETGQEAVISPERAKQLYCYKACTAEQQRYYRLMLTMVERLTEGFVDFGHCDNPRRDISVAYRALINDFPAYYWAPDSYYMSVDGDRLSLAFKKSPLENGYSYQAYELEDNRDELEDHINAILEKAADGANDFEKALILHDALCDRVTYVSGEEDDLYNLYGALINGQAVCEGYAKAYAVLCERAGIPCRVVCGKSKEIGHLWNLVQLDGTWTHVDVTWDDLRKETVHTYFGLTDYQISFDHDIDTDQNAAPTDALAQGQSFNYSLPRADDNSVNYFANKGLVFKGNDTVSMAKACNKAYKNGHFFAEFSFCDDANEADFKANYPALVQEVQDNLVILQDGFVCRLVTLSFTPVSCLLFFEKVS